MKTINAFFLGLFALSLLVSCNSKPQGEAAETADATEEAARASAEAVTYEVTSGVVNWVGDKPIGTTHNGTIDVKSGSLSVENGNITAGNFVMDMTTINDKDLEGSPDKKAKLEGHLKSDDFFAVETYPTSSFEVTKVEPLAEGGDATHRITGNLTMRGITKQISFPANVAVQGDMLTAVTPSFTINRTNWDVNFNASVLGTVGDALISDDVALVINLSAAKK
jgi:polyisoprenoid-binding protein YceI